MLLTEIMDDGFSLEEFNCLNENKNKFRLVIFELRLIGSKKLKTLGQKEILRKRNKKKVLCNVANNSSEIYFVFKLLKNMDCLIYSKIYCKDIE